MRLFVALVPPPAVLDALPATPPRVRAVPRHQVHLTLAFLGEVADPAPVRQALAVTQTLAAPALSLRGSGRFGSAVWLGLDGDLDVLATAAHTVQEAVRACGIALEDRDWRPHLTIARGRPWPGLHAGAAPEAVWDDVRLVRSHLGPNGARHESLHAWRLRTAPRAGTDKRGHG